MLELDSLRRLAFGPYSLSLGDGECVSIEGGSGSGKSVLLRMIADLDPHEGQAILDGRRCHAMPAPSWRRLVAYVAAESGWWAESVGEHFEDSTRAPPLMAAMGIGAEALAWPIARLSTGERQRLALCRALALAPRVLLLDEPTSALDHATTLLVEAVLRARLTDGVGIILVTHDPAQAGRMAIRRLVLRGGALAEQAT